MIIVKKADQRKDAVAGAALTLQRKTSSGDWENVRDLIDSVVGEGVDGIV